MSGLAELTLETNDLASMERFYRNLVGLTVLSRQSDRVWLAVGEHVRLGLWCPGSKAFGDRFARGDGARHGLEALA